jgi:regulation of enolase protein 1 (concanavalin A-like superfamily)
MRTLLFSGLLVACAVFAPARVDAQFVAYNDHAPGPLTGTNTTTYDVFGNAPGASGPLKDASTGVVLPVILTITTSDTGIAPAGTQGEPAQGTPLYNAFNGYVDFNGTPNPSIELTSGGEVTYTFTGLNPNKRYSFMGSAVRGNAPYTDRWTLFELAGAVSFTAAHTANVLTNGIEPLISPNQAAINTGVNNTPETGDMVVWTDIDPGPEGTFSVTCQQYTGPVPNGSSAGIKGYGMTGIRLEEFDVAPVPVTIQTQPQSQTIQEGQPVTFSVSASGNPPPTYQWYRGNAIIPNATNASYTIDAVQVTDDAAVFKVVASNTVSNQNISVTSDDATLSVVADTTPPTLVSIKADGLAQLIVTFSEAITGASATNIANYTLTTSNGPVTIDSVSFDTSHTSVLLTTATLSENSTYTLSVTGIRDRSDAGNLIAAGTQKDFSPIAYTPLDIGVTNVGGIFAVSGGYDVTGGGADIAGARDQFQFAYQQKSGDFDIAARVADLTISDAYVKAGLMVREALMDNARFAAVFASSAQLGSFWEIRSSVGASAGMAGPTIKFPSSYPWAWLRLRRSGNDFTGFGSFDGRAWQQLGTTTLVFTNDVYFGFAVTSGATNATATVKFRDIGPVTNPSTFIYTPEREAIGPANRRTGIIFSEIMYNPKPRLDGRSMDFVEIYNGEPIFVDLTGWKIGGGIDYTFPNGFKIGAGQFVVIAADPDAIQSTYGISGVLGPFTHKLSNTGDTLTLLNQSGAVRDDLTYSSEMPWPVAADGAGHSLVCTKPSFGEDDPRAWSASQLIGGSPGYDDPIAPNPWKGLLLNEILFVPGNGDSAFIEVYNPSSGLIDLSGCLLTDSPVTNKFRIPDGTHLAPGTWTSFTSQQLGFALSSAGGTIYLVSADQSRVLDVIRVGAQEAGVSVGRAPDADPVVRRLALPTPGQSNSDRKLDSIVINELMYHPISGEDDDQYIELYNRSASAVNVSGWRFVSGINFTIPTGTSIPANGYLVVARNVERMLTNYTQLSHANTIGNFSGKLSGGGEIIALAKPGGNAGEFITVAEFGYRTGGRWPELANGGGSSLELIDSRADPGLAPSWAASDETQKASWASYELTAPLTLANQTYVANKFCVMAQGEGDYLIDDVEVFRPGSTNLIVNSGFESGQTPWVFYGTHRTSFIQTSGAFSGNNCLHVHATEVGDEGPNSIRGNLSATLGAGLAYTVRAKLRWLSGWPEILLRIRGNGIEFPVRLQIPTNLGTPGLPNSRAVANAGPAITDVTHFPTLPAANQSVVVTARISDPDGVVVPQLIYRVDPSTTTSSIAMVDDGTGGDELAGDGIYSATIPARASGLVAFRIQAQDAAAPSASTLFPVDAPVHECLIRWADPAPFGSFGHYHMWSTTANANDVTSRPGQDRTYRDITVVYDTRVIYDAGWRNKGSPFHSGVGSYAIGFNDDDLFLGSDKHVFRSTGNGGDESTEMADDVAYWIGEKMGVPFNHARYVRVYRNGSLHYKIDYDLEVPDRSIAKDWFGGGGLDDTLYKIAGWFEYDDNANNGTSSLIWANFQKKPTTAPPYKTASYRFNFQPHPGGKTANDYSLLFALVAGANASDKVTQLMNVADMNEWMRVFAHRRVLGDWDSWSYTTGQNMYMYAPLGERARLMSWDMDFVLGLGDAAGTANFFSAGEDGIIGALFSVPTYRRMLCRAYLDAANGPLTKAASDPQFESRRTILAKNNLTATAPTSLKTYVASKRSTILSQIRPLDATAFAVATKDFTTNVSTATITGSAPFGVSSIEINGTPYPVTWTSPIAWSIKVPLGAVTNTLQIVARDVQGNVYTNGTGTVTVTYTGAIPNIADWVVINEIMYNASINNAEFIELYNSNPTAAFDLSGCKLKGASFTFPGGTLIQPNGFVVVAKDSASFASAYGATIPIAGEWTGTLQNSGETLSLVKPGVTPAEDIVIDEVRYSNTFPWPSVADGGGPSLQRIDAAQDSWRAGNWGVTAPADPNRATPGRANANRGILDPFPSLWINELVALNQTGATDGAGEHAPWVELYNSGSDPVDLTLYYLSNDPLNPIRWQFPPGTTIDAGQYLVIWLDGQVDQTTATEIHANFSPAASGGVIALSRLQSGAAANVDYMDYPGLFADEAFGSIVDGNPENQRLMVSATPGAANNPGNLLVPVTINEWMPSNVKVLADPADGDFEDWFELYNSGASAVDLSDYVLSNGTNSSSAFKIPFGYAIPAHGFMLVWADNETEQNTPTNADLHVNFKLSKAGDSIAVFTPTGALLDAVTFGALADNVSGGRYPDGAASAFVFTTPTPLAPNAAPPGTRFTRITTDGVQVTVGWRTTVGHTYRIESTADLTNPAWTQVGADVVATTTNSSLNLDFNAAANRFFRVVQVN